MKTIRFVLLLAIAIVAGFFASHWSQAQSGSNAASKGPITAFNNAALDQLSLLVSHLEATKQTNALKLFNDFANAQIALQSSAYLGVKLHILYAIRDGRTNEAIRLLEEQMTSDVVGFVGSYRELPVLQREQLGLLSLQEARDYCDKFKVTSGHRDGDEIVANAFKLLDEKKNSSTAP